MDYINGTIKLDICGDQLILDGNYHSDPLTLININQNYHSWMVPLVPLLLFFLGWLLMTIARSLSARRELHIFGSADLWEQPRATFEASDFQRFGLGFHGGLVTDSKWGFNGGLMVVEWWFNGGWMGFNGNIPSGYVKIAIENGHRNSWWIPLIPINSMVIFHSYVNVYQRVIDVNEKPI
jgi:hypothetical protein